MSVPQAVRSVLPVSFIAPLEKAFQVADECVTKAQGVYRNVQVRVLTGIKDVLPERMHAVAEKVARSIPETLVSFSMITGTLKIAASIFGVARLLWVATPMIKSALNGDFSGAPMDAALDQAKERLNDVKESFRPAIFVACGVSAVATAALGIVSLNLSLAMTGAFLGLISYMALESMQEVKPQEVKPLAKEAAESPDAAGAAAATATELQATKTAEPSTPD